MESAKDTGKNVEVNEHKNAYLDLLNEVNRVQLGGNFDMPKVMNSLNHFFYLADKATPKKPRNNSCPDCDSSSIYDYDNSYKCKRCDDCGQVIDWSKDE